MERMAKDDWFMGFALQASKRSHDAETQVGAVLMHRETHAILATGFNGFVRGAKDEQLPNTRPDKYPYMVHAEQNLIAHCARHGISMDNCYVYCTHSPCSICMRLLWQCGITRIVVKELYRDFDQIKSMKDLKINVSKAGDYYVLEYSND